MCKGGVRENWTCRCIWKTLTEEEAEGKVEMARGGGGGGGWEMGDGNVGI